MVYILYLYIVSTLKKINSMRETQILKSKNAEFTTKRKVKGAVKISALTQFFFF